MPSLADRGLEAPTSASQAWLSGQHVAVLAASCHVSLATYLTCPMAPLLTDPEWALQQG